MSDNRKLQDLDEDLLNKILKPTLTKKGTFDLEENIINYLVVQKHDYDSFMAYADCSSLESASQTLMSMGFTQGDANKIYNKLRELKGRVNANNGTNSPLTTDSDKTSEFDTNLQLEVDKIIKINPIVDLSDPTVKPGMVSTFNLMNLKKLLNERWFRFMPDKFSHFPQRELFDKIEQKEVKDSLFDFSYNASFVTYKFSSEMLSLVNINIDAQSSEDSYSGTIKMMVKVPAFLYKIRREDGNSKILTIETNKRQISMDQSSATSSKNVGRMMQPNENADHKRSIANMKPDFMIKDKYCRIGFRGEDKPLANMLVLAREQTEKTMHSLCKDHYSYINKSFAYASAGNTFQLFLVDHTQHGKPPILLLIYEFDLTSIHDRIKLFFNSMIITEICYRMFLKYPPSYEFRSGVFQEPFKLDKTLGKTEIEFIYGQNTVLKKFTPKPDFFKIDELEDHLKEFYKSLKKAHKKGEASYLVKYLSYGFEKYESKDEMTIWTYTEPLGIPFNLWKISLNHDTVKKLAKIFYSVLKAAGSIHALGYIHNDIRFPNIIFDKKTDQYLLIDFETIRKINCQCNQGNHSLNDDSLVCPLKDINQIQNLTDDKNLRTLLNSSKEVLDFMNDLQSLLGCILKQKSNRSKKKYKELFDDTLKYLKKKLEMDFE